jgi:LPS export ABC transporter protein LptC
VKTARIALWGTLLVAVVASFALLAYVRRGADRSPSPASAQPLYRVRNVVLTRWDAHGLVRYRLHARRLVRWSDVEDLTTVRLRYHPGRHPSAFLRARHGQRLCGRHRLLLWKDVRLLYRARPHAPRLRLVTSRLWIDTRSERATTRAPVTVTEGESTVRGVGLRATLGVRRLRLLSRVHAVLYPGELTTSAPAPSAPVPPVRAGRSPRPRSAPGRGPARSAPDPNGGARLDASRPHQFGHDEPHASSPERRDVHRS